MLRAKASPEALAVKLQGNPSYASDAELEQLAGTALDELVNRFRDYPK